MDLIPQKKPLPPKSKGKKIIISPTWSLHTSWLGGFIKVNAQKCLVNGNVTGGRTGVDSSLQDVLWISNPFLLLFLGGDAYSGWVQECIVTFSSIGTSTISK